MANGRAGSSPALGTTDKQRVCRDLNLRALFIWAFPNFDWVQCERYVSGGRCPPPTSSHRIAVIVSDICRETISRADMLPPDGVQRAGLDTIPASHAHVLENHRGFERTVQLLEHFMVTRRHGRTKALFRVAGFRIARFVIDYSK